MAKVHALLVPLVATLLLSGANAGNDGLSIEAQEPGQHHMAAWAVGRFAAAGLDLPRIVIRFPGRDLTHCDGAPGRVYLDHDPIEVRMCWNSEFVLLHELAHIWQADNVAAAMHEPFMAMRDGVLSWGQVSMWHGASGAASTPPT